VESQIVVLEDDAVVRVPSGPRIIDNVVTGSLVGGFGWYTEALITAQSVQVIW
jgi:hypothetical protein